MKTIEMDARTLAYIRVTGPYGEGYDSVYGQLHQWALARGLEGSEWIFIYHDNPEMTPPAQCRTDIGVTVPAGTVGTGGLKSSLFPPVITPSPVILLPTAVSIARGGRSISTTSLLPGWSLATDPVSSSITA